ncbi:MAG TPA: DUF1540 domain-containing protein [Oscillospiraceae bacterium]|nr:DUF1540 domain-containing protein [Oscillospiraceae bacterium]
MNDKKNPSIRCSVSQCAHHSTNGNYCSLQEISVGCSIRPVTAHDCTECSSFCLEDGCLRCP